MPGGARRHVPLLALGSGVLWWGCVRTRACCDIFAIDGETGACFYSIIAARVFSEAILQGHFDLENHLQPASWLAFFLAAHMTIRTVSSTRRPDNSALSAYTNG
jgi:hypothetical protein